MNFTVRRAKEGDIQSVMELLRQVCRVHHEGRPDLFKLATKYDAAELRAIFSDENTPVFVCEDDCGRILGHGNPRLLEDHLTLYIDDICVDEKARRRGVGEAIYNCILEFAREKGCYNITLNVWSCNPGAMKFYEKLGLVPYKVGMEVLL